MIAEDKMLSQFKPCSGEKLNRIENHAYVHLGNHHKH